MFSNIIHCSLEIWIFTNFNDRAHTVSLTRYTLNLQSLRPGQSSVHFIGLKVLYSQKGGGVSQIVMNSYTFSNVFYKVFPKHLLLAMSKIKSLVTAYQSSLREQEGRLERCAADTQNSPCKKDKKIVICELYVMPSVDQIHKNGRRFYKMLHFYTVSKI
jgi:hypothetical protein